jgi:hypothetical protein
MPTTLPDISRLLDARCKILEFQLLRCTNFPHGATAISMGRAQADRVGAANELKILMISSPYIVGMKLELQV